jgi:16S rRNA (uracil1498-N3)-methyltransferase
VTTLLVDAERLRADRVEVRHAEHRHLFRARRLGPGDRLRVVDGEGAARWGEVEAVARHAATVTLLGPAPANEPVLRLDLLVAAPRPQRAAWLVEKATEIGVGRIGFLASSRSPRRYGPATLERLTRVARAALEQSQRSHLPKITGPHEWQALDSLVTAEERWLLDPTADYRPLKRRP